MRRGTARRRAPAQTRPPRAAGRPPSSAATGHRQHVPAPPRRRSATSPLGTPNSAAAAAMASATYARTRSGRRPWRPAGRARRAGRPPRQRPAGRVLGERRATASASRRHRSRNGLLRRRPAGVSTIVRAGRPGEGAVRRVPAGTVVAVLADVRHARGRRRSPGPRGWPAARPRSVSSRVHARPGRTARRSHPTRRCRRRSGRPRRGSACRLRRERRLGRDRRETGRDRWRDRRHPVQVLGGGDLLGGRDPGLGARPAHAARAALVHPGRRDQRPEAPTTAMRAGDAELLGLVDRPADQLARPRRGRGRRCAGHVQSGADHVEAAVGDQVGAGHVRGVVGREEQRGAGQLLRARGSGPSASSTASRRRGRPASRRGPAWLRSR